ncbi:FAD-binding oxidoreductase [Roseibacterium sp. SDUM158016]|uniref:NAD(P)/FAD-dependent oxidoreductase n=1 Tax=Roseicyclus sediminis TaxID=2980997 RepID=UPI0021D1128A|nr:FAD-dependent oxidoreductase [Roseibacterium sp. SDUM158016]MCU4653433.1 FAD-binding oxidoreductase [Roseibacterium sp. SDUM158016]
MTDFDIAVAGAGIVGTSTALWAQMRGHRVVLLDPAPPGSGTSSGNACTIATYGCLPVNDPAVLTALPRLLFARDSPLSVSWSHALRNPRWMLGFLANCRRGPSRRIAGHLADLLSHADAGLNPLIAEAGAEDLILARGQLTIWSTAEAARGADAGLARRRELGVRAEEITVAEARALEPGLALPIERAVMFPEARHVQDPERLVQRFHARFEALGGTTVSARVTATRAQGDHVRITADGRTLTAGRVVLAAGAFSGAVAGSGAERLPLGTERGYHLLYSGEAHRISRPVGWAEGGFYAVPMARGLRLAGTVEIAGRDAPPNPARLAYLERRGQEMFGTLPAPTSSWLGFRPTMPDSLPVIGRSPASERIIHAFGHQHLGLTLGGITGRIACDLAEGRQPNIAIDAYRPGRRYA